MNGILTTALCKWGSQRCYCYKCFLAHFHQHDQNATKTQPRSVAEIKDVVDIGWTRMDRQTDSQIVRQIEGNTDERQSHGWKDGWLNEWTDWRRIRHSMQIRKAMRENMSSKRREVEMRRSLLHGYQILSLGESKYSRSTPEFTKFSEAEGNQNKNQEVGTAPTKTFYSRW